MIRLKAKEYLQQIEMLDRMIINKLSEVAKWEASATSTTAYSEGERVKSSGSKQKMADAIDICIDLKAEIEACKAKRREIIAVIEQLKPDEYDLLYKVYVQGYMLKQAAPLCKMSYSSATTIHGQALKKVQRILDKRGTE